MFASQSSSLEHSSSASGLPFVVSPPGDSAAERIAWIAAHRAELAGRLSAAGAIRFSNLGAVTIEAFDHLALEFFDAPMAYVGGDAQRSRASAVSYSSSEMAAEMPIAQHNELSYASSWPAQLLFGCIVAPESGGETPLADCRALLAALDPHVVREFERRGVRYVRNLHGGRGFGRSWQQTFETLDRDVVAAHCRAAGVELTWTAGGAHLEQRRPALAIHPVTGQRVWFNQAEQYHPSTIPKALYESLLSIYGDDPDELPRYATFGDGGAFALDMLESIRSSVAQLTVAFPWETGDALWIDNLLVSHGRAPYSGARRIVVAMA